MGKMKDTVCMDTVPVEDKCYWSFCDYPAYGTWAGKAFCYSCFFDILDSKD